jgi:hypothetical protein
VTRAARDREAEAAARPAPAPVPAGLGPSRGRPRGRAHPETWRLRDVVLAARERLPFATAEARLLDGLRWFVEREARAVPALSPASGVRWAQTLALVSAVHDVCSPETQALLLPWSRAVTGHGPAPAPGAVPAHPADGGGLDLAPWPT